MYVRKESCSDQPLGPLFTVILSTNQGDYSNISGNRARSVSNEKLHLSSMSPCQESGKGTLKRMGLRLRDGHEEVTPTTRMNTGGSPPTKLPFTRKNRLGIRDIHVRLPHKLSASSDDCVGPSAQEFLIKFICKEMSTQPTLAMKDFFHEYTEFERASYDNEVTSAVRAADLDRLRVLHAQKGRTFQCSNNFGESLLHMACRRGSLDIVKFLTNEAKVSVLCCDDFGRTPLHDACWCSYPNFDLVDLLIFLCPKMLLMSDRRGHAPLEYTRPEHRALWISFLEARKDGIANGVIAFERSKIN